jgi:CRISPR/Cas system CMR-associated protein Cmr5 small subunit
MDDVEKLISEIENNNEIMKVRFTGLLDETANMLEKHGFGVTKAFLLEKQGHKELRWQAEALLKILGKIEEYPGISSDKKTARLIIKSVDSLRLQRGGKR